MAEIKKYLDSVAVGALVDQIKAEDEKAVAAAKKYTDDTAKTLETAGAAATALADAKSYTDTEIASKADAKGSAAAVDAKLTTEVGRAQGEEARIEGLVTAAQEKANKNAEDIAAINNAETGILKQAKDYTNTEVGKVQAAVNAHEAYVGTIPETSEAASVIAYIDEKTAGIATDAALSELQASVTQMSKDLDAAELDIDNIQKDYLKAADKAELQGGIDAVDALVDALVGEDTGKSARTIANEELAKQLIAEGAKESLDTLQEIAAWIQAHPDDASEMNKAIGALETLVGTIPEDVTATTIVGYIAEAVAAEKQRAEAIESGLDSRIEAIELQLGEGEGSVSDQIADAKQEAIDAAAGDATTKADAAREAAKTYADGLNTSMNTRVEALEAVDHEHANKALLDTYTQTEANLADAVAKKHEHANKAVLDGINAEKVSAWDGAEQAAKDYADGLNTTMSGRVDAVVADVAENAEAIALKADKTALEAAVADIATNAAGIAANKSAIESFTPITAEEINAMFA